MGEKVWAVPRFVQKLFSILRRHMAYLKLLSHLLNFFFLCLIENIINVFMTNLTD